MHFKYLTFFWRVIGVSDRMEDESRATGLKAQANTFIRYTRYSIRMQCCGGSPAGRMQKDLIQFYQLRKSWCWPFRYSRIRRPNALDFANLCATFGHQAWWEGVGATKRFARQTGRQENVCRSAHHSRTKSIRIFELFPLPCLQAMFGSGQLRLWQHCSGLQTDRHGLAMVSYQCSDISLSPVRSAYVLSISIYETTTCNTYIIYTSVNI